MNTGLMKEVSCSYQISPFYGIIDSCVLVIPNAFLVELLTGQVECKCLAGRVKSE